MPIALDISFYLVNEVWEKVKLLTVAIVGFRNSSSIAALRMSCLMHQCANRYSSSRENSHHRSISLLNVSYYSLLLGLPARRLSTCGVPKIRVRTGGWSGLIHEFSLSASLSLESSSPGSRKGTWCGSWTNQCRLLLCSIAEPSCGSCSADTYTFLALWSRQRWVM